MNCTDFAHRFRTDAGKRFVSSFIKGLRGSKEAVLNSSYQRSLIFGRLADREDTGKIYDQLLFLKNLVGTSISTLRRQVMAEADAETLKLFDRMAEKKSQFVTLAFTRQESDPKEETAARDLMKFFYQN